ncbi:MAG: hypothetical protein LBL80_02025 [Ruminococcus sp.]|jgi:hypothetical protein|nr:hypothetical protein [Ruminococcus sp.]
MNKKRKINLAYFWAMIAVTTLLVFVSLALALLPRPSESELENRELAAFPKFTVESYLDGSFTRDLTKWFADTVPLRDNLVELSGQIKELEGIRQDNVKFHGNVEIVKADDSDEIPEVIVTTAPPKAEIAEADTAVTEVLVTEAPAVTIPGLSETVTAPPAEDQTMEFDNNGIVTVGDRSFMLFGGSKSQGKYYADVLNAYKISLGENVNVYNMVVPTAVEFYLPAQYSDYSNSELTQIKNIYENLVGVTPIDAYSKLASHTGEDIYLKTDHHWSQLGAYYASTAFAEVLGETVQPITDFEAISRDGFVGSLYGYTNDIKIKESPEVFTYYKQPLPYTTEFFNYDTLTSRGFGQLIYEAAAVDNSYAMFIGMDAVHTHVVTENKNGKRLTVFKESFGNALIPELIPYFEEIYVIDIRFFGMNAIDYMKQKNITDVLFINNIFAANTQSLIKHIDDLRFGSVGVKTETIATTAETPVTTAPIVESVTAAETVVAETLPAETLPPETLPPESSPPAMPTLLSPE